MNTIATSTDQAARELLGSLYADMADAFEMCRWAESEIQAAMRRHPGAADRLWHSFALLAAPLEHVERMRREEVYRAHAQEILERVAAGEDTRPATAVELVAALLGTATTAPLSHEGFGLLARMWKAAGLPDNDGFDTLAPHVEALTGERIDREEHEARRRCGDEFRKLADRIECDGMHHGRQTACRYAAAA